METYTALKPLVDNPHFHDQKRAALAGLRDDMIDEPIRDLIKGLNGLPYCFTLQCCDGHFVYGGQSDPHNLEPLPLSGVFGKVEYRIAYIALCIENSPAGREFSDALKRIPLFDPQNVQYCCAEWFWDQQVNSYALQVEPDRYKDQDTAMLDYDEALIIEKIRNEFFGEMRKLLQSPVG